MADLKIAEAPELTTIGGDEKIPTGNSGGNFSIVVDALAQFVKDSKNLQNSTEVDAVVAPVEMEVATHVADLVNPHQVTKEQVGLGNVDNTADADKPISNAVQSAITTLTTNKADKTYVDSQLATKSDKLTTYTKAEVDTLLTPKANQSTTYTKVEVDTKLSDKQEKLSIDGILTGTNTFSNIPSLDGLDGNPSSVMNQQAQALMNRTENLRYGFKTGLSYYDSVYSSSIGGYPINSTISLSNGNIVINNTNNNINDPNTDMTGWAHVGKFSPIVDYISDMVAINNAYTGAVVKVGAYKSGIGLQGGGKFKFVAGDVTTVNNVTVFNGVGGRWFRLNWKSPDIYDAGLDGTETDATAKFQALVDAATSNLLSVNLCKKMIKVTQLDIPDDMHIYNGTLDVTSSTWQNTYGRAALMFKSTPRNATGVDYEINTNYVNIIETKNIKFVNTKFKSDGLAGIFFKFNGLKFLGCEGEWNTQNLFKFVGGWHGTPLVADTPTSYNLVDPINGRNKNIIVKDCKWNGGYFDYGYSSPFRFVACEDVYIAGGKNDCPLGWHIDIYNKGFTLDCADYVNTNDQVVLDTISGVAHPDMLALYVGQNCYEINVNGGRWKDFGNKGAYIECCSQVTIDGVVSKCTNPSSVATFIDLQPNYKDNANTYWGNVADVTIKNCVSNGTKYGIKTTPFGGVKSLRNINILDNVIKTNSVFDAVALIGVESYVVKNTGCNGSLYIGVNNTKGLVKNSEFYNASNFALYIADQSSGELPDFFNNSFVVDSGSAIYNNGGSGKIGRICGGKLKAGEGSSIMQLGTAADLVAYDFENGLTQRSQNFSQNITIAGNSTATYTKSIVGVRNGWTGSMSVHGIDELGYDLSFIVSCKTDQIVFKVKNNAATAVNFTPNLLLRLNSFLDQVFIN